MFSLDDFFKACCKNNLVMVKLINETSDFDVNASDEDGWTALHYVMSVGAFEVLKYLVQEYGADMDAKDNEGLTPKQISYVKAVQLGVTEPWDSNPPVEEQEMPHIFDKINRKLSKYQE